MEAMIDPRWRKSSYSDNGGNCTEVAAVPEHAQRSSRNSVTPGMILVRDTKDNGNGPVLAFRPQTWKTFLRDLKAR